MTGLQSDDTASAHSLGYQNDAEHHKSPTKDLKLCLQELSNDRSNNNCAVHKDYIIKENDDITDGIEKHSSLVSPPSSVSSVIEESWINVGKGIRKRIISAGNLLPFVTFGSYLTLSWKSYVEGNEDPFEVVDTRDYVLQKDETDFASTLPKGFRDCAMSMLRCEHAIFEIPPDKCFDDEYRPSYVPSDTKLIYDLKCLSISEEFTLVKSRHGKVLIRQLEDGKGLRRSSPGDRISIHYRMYFDDGTLIHDTYLQDKPLTFMLFNCEVMPGIDIALINQKSDAVINLKLSPEYAYGISNNNDYAETNEEDEVAYTEPSITEYTAYGLLEDICNEDRMKWPHYSNGSYLDRGIEFKDMCVVDFGVTFNCWELDEVGKREAADSFSEIGKRHYRRDRYNLAAIYFRRALNYLEENGGDATIDDLAIAKKMLIKMYNNIAMTLIRRQQFHEALIYAEKAISVNTCNQQYDLSKSFYRIAICKRELGYIDKALEGLLEAHKLAPTDELIKLQLTELIQLTLCSNAGDELLL